VRVKEYVEVSKPRIVVVLVITAVTSLLAGSRFDNTSGWHVTAWQLGFLALAGALASMGSSALNHYYDRDIDKIMYRTSSRPIPSGRLSPRNVMAYGLGMSILSVILGVDYIESRCDEHDCPRNIFLCYGLYCMA